MSIIWMDGFDVTGATILSRNYQTVGSQVSSTNNSGRYDGFSLQIIDSSPAGSEATRLTNGIHKNISNTDVISVGMSIVRLNAAHNAMMANTTSPMIFLYNGTPVQNNMIAGCSISGTTPNFFANIMNRTGNLISIPIPYFDFLAWNNIELEITTSTTVGEARMYLNGKIIASVSGVNFSTSTSNININYVSITPTNGNSSWGTKYDDFYITNTNQRLGEVHITTLAPSADTVQKQWSPSAGLTNYTQVRSTSYENAQYITANNHNLKDLYELDNLASYVTSTNSGIVATRTIGSGYKLFFGESNVSLIIKSGPTETAGPGIDLYEGLTAIFPLAQMINEINPNTGLVWTITDINNLQVGIKTN